MVRHLLIVLAAVALALPGIISVTTSVTDCAGSRRSASPSPVAVPLVLPTITPSASPSPGDVTPPVTTASGMGSRWRNDAATVKFTATDDASGVAATVYRIDGGTWQIGDQLVVRAPKDHSNDGEHTITFYSVDNAFNEETTKTATVKIDTRPPHFAWKSVTPSIIRRVEPVTLRITIDERSGPVKLSYKVTDQYGYSAVSKAGLERDAGARSIQLTPRYPNHKGFVPGVYRVQITIRDEAGNSTVSKRRSFRDLRAVSGGVWHRISGAGRMVALTFDDGNNTRLGEHPGHAQALQGARDVLPARPVCGVEPFAGPAHGAGRQRDRHSRLDALDDDAPEREPDPERVDARGGALVERHRLLAGAVLPAALRRHELGDDVGVGRDRLLPRDPLGRGSARLEPAGRGRRSRRGCSHTFIRARSCACT